MEPTSVNLRINYVLVDHENVQPTDVAALDRVDVRLLMFVGNKQTKLCADVAMQMQEMGARAKYIRVSAIGANALDFHIAYHIGRLAAQDAAGYFHVVSKDKGYDPLLQHLKEQGIAGGRFEAIASLPFVKKLAAAPPPAAAGSKSKTATSVPVIKAGAGTATVNPAKKQKSQRVQFIVDPDLVPSASPRAETGKSTGSVVVSLALADSKKTTQRWVKLRASLKKMDKNLPSSLTALKKHINALFNVDSLGPDVVDAMVKGLVGYSLLSVAPTGSLSWHIEKF